MRPAFWLLILTFVGPIQAQELDSGFLPWQRILHMHGATSAIDAPPFFLSPRGKYDAAAEWQAMETADPKAVACNFPARVLVHQKMTGKVWPAAPCLDFLEWKQRFRFHSVSLVYSTAFAGNPASVLGHNLLKFNAADETPLLDYGLGFSAQTDPNDGRVSYVLKGMFGGYPGFYTLQPYYMLVNAYAFAENRDLWELEISLTSEERELLLAHVWELTHFAAADYYFTHVNCSTMLLDVLDAVKPDWNLRGEFHGFVLPQALMQAVAAHEAEPRQAFWPSQKRIFDQQWNLLNAAQKDQFLDWKKTEDLVAVADDPAILDAILDQINLQKNRLEITEQATLRERENQVLLARSQLPAMIRQSPGMSSAGNNPLLSHGTHKFTLLAGRSGDEGLLGARLRYGLHDLLDEPHGYNPYYHINYFDLQMTMRETVNYQFDIVDLLSLNPYSSVDPSGSWAVAGGLRDGQAQLRAAYGLSWELAPQRSLIYSMPAVDLHPGNSSVGLRLGWFYSVLPGWRQLIEWSPRWNETWRWDWQWQSRWTLDRTWQLEAQVAREDRLRVLGGVGQYF